MRSAGGNRLYIDSHDMDLLCVCVCVCVGGMGICVYVLGACICVHVCVCVCLCSYTQATILQQALLGDPAGFLRRWGQHLRPQHLEHFRTIERCVVADPTDSCACMRRICPFSNGVEATPTRTSAHGVRVSVGARRVCCASTQCHVCGC